MYLNRQHPFFALALLCWVYVPNQSPAQTFDRIDAIARQTRAPKDHSVEKLAASLAANCQSEKEKARAFFVWMAENIRYDIKTFEKSDDLSHEKWSLRQEPEQVIKTEKAVCAGYTRLYNALCHAVGMEALEVDGITKDQRGRVRQGGHAWSLVRADGQWYLVDATWGAGDVDIEERKYIAHFKPQYFFPAPETMLANHFPFDPLFQLLPAPLTEAEFNLPTEKMEPLLAKKTAGKPTEGFGSLHDSLSAYVALDSTERLLAAANRSLAVDPGNNHGLCQLAAYQLAQGRPAMLAFQQSIREANQTPKIATSDWIKAQLRHLDAWESAANQCLKTLSAATRTNKYSEKIRNLRRNAESALSSIRYNRKSMEAALKH